MMAARRGGPPGGWVARRVGGVETADGCVGQMLYAVYKWTGRVRAWGSRASSTYDTKVGAWASR